MGPAGPLLPGSGVQVLWDLAGVWGWKPGLVSASRVNGAIAGHAASAGLPPRRALAAWRPPSPVCRTELAMIASWRQSCAGRSAVKCGPGRGAGRGAPESPAPGPSRSCSRPSHFPGRGGGWGELLSRGLRLRSEPGSRATGSFHSAPGAECHRNLDLPYRCQKKKKKKKN